MKIKLTIFLLFLISAMGCEKIELDRPFDCKIGSNYKVAHDLSFTIDSLNDSRCPPDMECFTAGTVYLFFSIMLNNSKIDTILYQDPARTHPYLFGGYKFSVIEVEPISLGTTKSKNISIELFISEN